MKKILLSVICLSAILFTQAQKKDKKNFNNSEPKNTAYLAPASIDAKPVNEDSVIKEKLVALALKNPAVKIADANIEIANISLKKAKSSFLSSVTVGGNINEFVVNNSEAASFFPKYNAGIALPLDVFSRTKADKRTASQNIIISKELKENKVREVRSAVLIMYENYKEKRELVRLQKIAMEPDYQSYVSAQKNYSEGTMQLEEMDKYYQAYVNQQAKLVTAEKNFTISSLELEEVIGVSVEQAIKAK